MNVEDKKIVSRDILKLRSIFNEFSDAGIRNDYKLLTSYIKKVYSEILDKDLIKLNEERNRVKKILKFLNHLLCHI